MSTAPPFWFGKLPTLGDFASRRWPPSLLEAWDGWLASEIQAQQHRMGNAWVNAYLQSPTWRFVLPAHALGTAQQRPMAGVLMPSVDKVGRYFPLTVACWLDHLPTSAAQAQALCEWLQRSDDLAADALYEDWSLDTWEAALHAHRPVHLCAPAAAVPTSPPSCAPARHLLQAVAGPTPPPSWWWSAPSDPACPRHTLCMHGLPRGQQFAQLWQPTGAPLIF